MVVRSGKEAGNESKAVNGVETETFLKQHCIASLHLIPDEV